MGKKVMLAIPLFLGREAASLGQLEVNCGGRRKERKLHNHALSTHWAWSIILGLYLTCSGRYYPHLQMRRVRQQNESLVYNQEGPNTWSLLYSESSPSFKLPAYYLHSMVQ